MSNRITIHHLRGACHDQRALFRRTFPDGAPLTRRSLDRALSVGLRVSWLRQLLSPAARAEYWRVTASALAEYDRVRARARAEYQRVTAPAQAEYDRVRARAWAEYDRVCGYALLPLLRAVLAEGRSTHTGSTIPPNTGR